MRFISSVGVEGGFCDSACIEYLKCTDSILERVRHGEAPESRDSPEEEDPVVMVISSPKLKAKPRSRPGRP